MFTSFFYEKTVQYNDSNITRIQYYLAIRKQNLNGRAIGYFDVAVSAPQSALDGLS